MPAGPSDRLFTLSRGWRRKAVVTPGVCLLTLVALDSDERGLIAGIINYYSRFQ